MYPLLRLETGERLLKRQKRTWNLSWLILKLNAVGYLELLFDSRCDSLDRVRTARERKSQNWMKIRDPRRLKLKWLSHAVGEVSQSAFKCIENVCDVDAINAHLSYYFSNLNNRFTFIHSYIPEIIFFIT